jgi:hypothetical protein
VRALIIIFVSPLLKDDLRFQEAAKEFPVQALVAQLVVEAFDVAVFPRAARFDVDGFDPVLLQPVLDRIGDEFRPAAAGLWILPGAYSPTSPLPAGCVAPASRCLPGHALRAQGTLAGCRIYPAFSARDIVELLAYYLPRRNRTEDQIFEFMQLRYNQLARDITPRKTFLTK